ncbi:MAG: hypothetical protein M3326_05500 [Actinomycetota bacterium]|nr:hypothetical protein [Actinomycetota bacterium]
MPKRTDSQCPDDQWPADDPVLASFAEDLRIVAEGPAPEPRPGLVAVMRQGTVTIEPSTTGRKKKMLVKTLLGGLASKLAMGVGLATATVTAAGAAGVLPDAAQHAVASVVEATTPFVLPDPSDVTTLVNQNPVLDGVTTTTSSTVAGAKDTEADDVGDDNGGTRPLNHGACVSTAAKDKSADDGSQHGKTVSSIARSDCGKTDASSKTSTTVSSITSTTLGTTTTTAAEPRSANSGPGSSNSGKGNSGNAGGSGSGGNSGNSGKGNSGK